MTGNRISRSKLNTELKKLPLPVQEHCKRCKLIASFLLERIKGEDWFLDTKLNADHIASAVFLHDIGKASIPRDNIYSEHNVVKAKQEIYRSHVQKGVELAETLCDIRFADFDDKKFETYVYQAITEHHESADGCGFPKRLNSGKMSLTGKITAIADTVDNLFFVGNTEIGDIAATTETLAEMSGNQLDKELLGVMLADREAFIGFIEYIDSRYRNKRKNDSYGLQLHFSRVKNIIENETRELYLNPVINDPFYGAVEPAVFIPVAKLTSQISRLTLIIAERLCLAIARAKERDAEFMPVSIDVAPECFEAKKFVYEMIKLLEKYSIKKDLICLVIDEKGLEELEDVDYRDCFGILRNGGFRVALKSMSEGTSLIGALDSLQVDYLVIDRSFTARIAENTNTYGVASGILDIAHNLHLSVIFTGADSHNIEKNLLKLHVRYACGELYGEPIKENELISALANGGGDVI
jgi:EAL domain-containing protein (putative c-di-GMP-specific phosphodiesterase class I)